MNRSHTDEFFSGARHYAHRHHARHHTHHHLYSHSHLYSHHHNSRPNRRKMTPVDTRRNPGSNKVGNNKSYPARFENTSPSAQPWPSKLVHYRQSKPPARTRALSVWLRPSPVWAGSTWS